MPVVSFPDGGKRNYAKGVPFSQVALDLRVKPLAVRVDGELKDLSAPIERDCRIEFIDFSSDEGKAIYWHSAAHILASAVKAMRPGTKLGVGPAIEEGFYYDFDTKPFAAHELEAIERKMAEVCAAALPFERLQLSKEAARKLLEGAGESYKLELLEEISEPVTFYRHGAFVDLCKGPHVPSTSTIAHFKLLDVSAAYWRGDATKPSLQRIYGIAYPTREQLEQFLWRREEAKRRDHRRLGRELELFIWEDYAGAGLPLWQPRGATLRQIIMDWELEQHLARGYQPVYTPHIMRSITWRKSGHYDCYKEQMFTLDVDGEEYAIKPMNCPAHIFLYKARSRSWRELPIRYFEFGVVYRRELSGVLSGLFRVRSITQDDAHIFCTEEQLEDEIKNIISFALDVMATFGFVCEVALSTRPERSIGEEEKWRKATDALRRAAESLGLSYRIDEGEGAFYGPKLDFHFRDALGRRWQGPTIQLDFFTPERFDVTYVDKDGEKKGVIMIHRTILGSVERFMGVLIEHFAGSLPTWLAPEQVVILPVSDGFVSAAQQLRQRLSEAGLRASVDARSATVEWRIRESHRARIPYILVFGGREVETGLLTIRSRGRVYQKSVDEFIKDVCAEVKEKKLPVE